jgi:very-short-patch-repair endonuclease
LSTPDRLLAHTETVGRVKYLATMRYALQDIGGGARAMSEIDVARLCRTAGLPEPRRQVRRRDPAGRWRYLDVHWEVSKGSVVLEIDGVGHLEVERWYDDLLRAAEVSGPGETVLRLPAAAARLEPQRVVAILRRHLLA